MNVAGFLAWGGEASFRVLDMHVDIFLYLPTHLTDELPSSARLQRFLRVDDMARRADSFVSFLFPYYNIAHAVIHEDTGEGR